MEFTWFGLLVALIWLGVLVGMVVGVTVIVTLTRRALTRSGHPETRAAR